MKPTINLVFRMSKALADGSGYIYLRLTIDRISKYYTTGVQASIVSWDKVRQVITLRDSDFRQKNELLELFYTKADDILHTLKMDQFDNPVSFDQFESKFTTRKITMLADFADLYLQERKTILQESTKARYKSSIKKIRDYGNVSMHSVNYNWVKGYESHLRNDLGVQHNTVAKEIKFIISVFNEARKRGIIPDNRALNYSIGFTEVYKDFLTIDELRALILKLRDPEFPNNYKRVLYYFVFSCLTGLRISDIKNLKLGDFNQGFTQIDIVTVKTKERIVLPLSEPAREIVKEYMKYQKKRFQYSRPELPFFKVHSDQHNNIILPNIMIDAKIDKQIRYHNSRHTFATICNELGLPIAVTSKLMTHKTLRMTLQYAKFNDPTLQENIEKWDRLMRVSEKITEE